MKHSFIILIVAFFSSMSNSCKKTSTIAPDNPFGLPNATQSGANIFACRVNDSNWIVEDSIFKTLGTSFSRSNNRNTLWILASGAANRTFDLISFTIFDKIKTGSSYRLNDTTKALANTFRILANCGQTVGYGGSQSNNANDGNITITRYSGNYFVPSCCTYGSYDPNAIISGTFNFIIAIPNCDTIKVTNGRFDINYSQY